MPQNLLDLDGEGLARYIDDLGEKPFRARQLQRWIHRAGESEIAYRVEERERNGKAL